MGQIAQALGVRHFERWSVVVVETGTRQAGSFSSGWVGNCRKAMEAATDSASVCGT